MADVFLSYASEDRDRVKPLADALESRGYSVWWDRSLAAGDDFSAVIQRELADAKAVIVVWTARSVASVWVRDEAGRARDQGRLVPVKLDAVEIPLGFGAIQAEDFSAWNGAAGAAQMQLLEEALKAKLEGRGVDAAAVDKKRRRLMNRIRIVSVLSVVAAVVGIAAGVNNLVGPRGPNSQQIENDAKRQDTLANLVRLVENGTITPEQAIELSRLLEQQTFASAASVTDAEEVPPTPSLAPDASTTTEPAQPGPTVVQASEATVTAAEFNAAARDSYRAALATLVRHGDPAVRQAALDLSDPVKQAVAMQTLWDYAAAHPADQAAIYRVCGAVGGATDNPLGVRALERLRAIAPDDSDVWRMLSYGLQRQDRPTEAAGAALVSEGLSATTAAGQEARLQQALPRISDQSARVFVEQRLDEACVAAVQGEAQVGEDTRERCARRPNVVERVPNIRVQRATEIAPTQATPAERAADYRGN